MKAARAKIFRLHGSPAPYRPKQTPCQLVGKRPPVNTYAHFLIYGWSVSVVSGKKKI